MKIVENVLGQAPKYAKPETMEASAGDRHAPSERVETLCASRAREDSRHHYFGIQAKQSRHQGSSRSLLRGSHLS